MFSGKWRFLITSVIFGYAVYLTAVSYPDEVLVVSNWGRKGYDSVMTELDPVLQKVGPTIVAIGQRVEESEVFRHHVAPTYSVVRDEFVKVKNKVAANEVVVEATSRLHHGAKYMMEQWQLRVQPPLQRLLKQTVETVSVLVNKSLLWLQLQVAVFGAKTRVYIHHGYKKHVCPFFQVQKTRIQSTAAYKKAEYYYDAIGAGEFLHYFMKGFDALLHISNFQGKSKFLQKEAGSLFHSKDDSSVPEQDEEKVAEIVEDILEEILSMPEEVETITRYSTFTVTSTSEELSTTLLGETVASSVQDVIEESKPDAGKGVGETLANIAQARVNQEIYYWESKVNRTIAAAISNIEADMHPIINQRIESLKESITKNFSSLQQQNYKSYKELNIMISDIDKNTIALNEANKIIDFDATPNQTFHSRQDMRDKIKESRTYCQEKTQEVDEVLIENHKQILSEYFKILQESIDILESFADLTVQEFSSRLHSLLALLEEEDEEGLNEEITWKSWKKFHQIKETIFDARDALFNEANKYQQDSSKSVPPKALESWNVYSRGVQYHSSFLVRDNEEYLQLVRAKANVAFQLREETVRRIESAVSEETADSQASEDDSTGNESTGNEFTDNESTGNESTGNESTGNESTGNESTGNESTGNESTSNESRDKDAQENDSHKFEEEAQQPDTDPEQSDNRED